MMMMMMMMAGLKYLSEMMITVYEPRYCADDWKSYLHVHSTKRDMECEIASNVVQSEQQKEGNPNSRHKAENYDGISKDNRDKHQEKSSIWCAE